MAREASEKEIEAFLFDAPFAKFVRGPHCSLLRVGSLCFEILGPDCDECGEEIDWTAAFAVALRRAVSATTANEADEDFAQ